MPMLKLKTKKVSKLRSDKLVFSHYFLIEIFRLSSSFTSDSSQEHGLKSEDEVILAGPFSGVALMITDKTRAKWVNSNLVGSTSLVLLKDVGAPITVVRTR